MKNTTTQKQSSVSPNLHRRRYVAPDATGAKRIVLYDAIRAISIVLIILIHSFMSARNITVANQHAHDAILRDFLTSADVVLFWFIFTSGALVWGPKWEPGVHEYRRFVLDRFIHVVVPYLAWSSLFIILLFLDAPGSQAPFSADYIAHPGSIDYPSLFTLAKRAVIYVVTGSSWFHLYFTPVVVSFYLMTPLVSWALRARRHSADITLAVAIALGIVGTALFPAPHAGEATYFLHSYAYRFSFFLPAMALGGWFQFRLGSWAEYVSESIDRRGWLHRIRRLAIIMSDLSFGTYYVHALFILMIQLTLSTLGLNELWAHTSFILLVFIVVTFSSYGFTYILSKWRVTKWLT